MNKLLVFDLDGTLIDSAGGIASAVNHIRKKYGFAPLDKDVIISCVGNGAKKLMERTTADVSLPLSLDEITAEMTAYYEEHPVSGTIVYPGVLETLPALAANGYHLAILSNKPQSVSEKILAEFDIARWICANIGGNGGFPLKPEPDALFHLLKKFDADPGSSFVIGDNYTDLAAAKNAGMRSIFCRYGIGKAMDCLPDHEIDSFAELPAALKTLSN